ncbi:hypothetical protein AO265_22390 [Pseudomonas sp. ABAC61]|nr:hypothetical protein AO265_22390 [Pseudomonas sp. ABAC61]
MSVLTHLEDQARMAQDNHDKDVLLITRPVWTTHPLAFPTDQASETIAGAITRLADSIAPLTRPHPAFRRQ